MEIIAGILIRHALAAAGAYFVTKGYADGATMEQVGGAAATVVSFVLSIFNKKRTGAL